MTRRRLLALVCFSAPIVGVAVACGFPDVEYKTDAINVPETGADTNSEAAAGDASSDGGGDTGIGDPDGGAVDASACRNSCDCDGDKWWRYADSGCDLDATDAAGRLGFGDCDDFNTKYFPGQTQYFQTAAGLKGFDYDCDGVETGKFKGSLNCTGLFTSCPAGDFTAAPPGCGMSGDFSSCVASGLGCAASLPGDAKQPCR